MKSLITVIVLLNATVVFADTKIKVEIKELSNFAKSTALEACGTAVHSEGVKPLLVTLTHDASAYTTLTNEQGQWCINFKRWTNDGKVNVSASTLDFKDHSQ